MKVTSVLEELVAVEVLLVFFLTSD